jgi:pimeloyl-ACP methyl ester carboxylesterase
MDFHYVVIPALIVLTGGFVGWLSIRRFLSLQRRSYPSWRKVTERIAFSGIALTALAVAASSGFNAIALHANKLPGETYSVNGHKMRIDCTGSGSPTILLEAGAGNDGLIWGGVQPVLAKTTRVCSYDRAGFGGSEALPPPRDADHIAGELHGLLVAAKLDGPIVLMGHSLGGIFIRDYATRYPKAIAGLIFVDSATPLQQRDPAFRAFDAQEHQGQTGMLLNKAVFALGIPRLIGACSASRSELNSGFDAHAAELLAEDRCHEPFATIAGEAENLDRSGEETLHTGPYGAMPILIFSHDVAVDAGHGRPADLAAAFSQMQEDLKKLSTRSRRVIAKGSGHYIQLDRPELIEREASLFIGEFRGVATGQQSSGSTTE